MSREQILSIVSAWWDWIDDRGIVRRLVLAVAIWMTWRVSVWAMGYASTSPRPGLEIAAIIGAVTAPVTMFGGYIFSSYVNSRKDAP